MLVTVNKDTIVRVIKGTTLDLPDEEARRLIMLGNAEKAEADKPKKRKK